MTEREMALSLGNYVIKLQNRILVYEGVFMEYRINTPHGPREIPFRDDAKRIAQEDALKQIAVEQRNALLQDIGDETHGSELIRALCRQFLEEK